MNFIVDVYRKIMRQLTPLEVAAAELAEAELRLLEAESAVEYAQSVVSYNQARIRRLRKLFNEMPGLPDGRN